MHEVNFFVYSTSLNQSSFVIFIRSIRYLQFFINFFFQVDNVTKLKITDSAAFIQPPSKVKVEGGGEEWEGGGPSMSHTPSIELNLEHQDLVFYSGDRIRGALVVHLSTAVTIAGRNIPS